MQIHLSVFQYLNIMDSLQLCTKVKYKIFSYENELDQSI